MKALDVAQRFGIKVRDAKGADGSVDASRQALKVRISDKVAQVVLGAFVTQLSCAVTQTETIVGSYYFIALVPTSALDAHLSAESIGAVWLVREEMKAQVAAEQEAAYKAALAAAESEDVDEGEEEEEPEDENEPVEE